MTQLLYSSAYYERMHKRLAKSKAFKNVYVSLEDASLNNVIISLTYKNERFKLVFSRSRGDAKVKLFGIWNGQNLIHTFANHSQISISTLKYFMDNALWTKLRYGR